jgi:phosphonate transport system substrate-binding protein
MKKVFRAGILALLCLTLLAVSPGHLDAQALVFGTYPFGDPVRVQRGLTPLVHYLTETTGIPMRLVVTRDYNELSRRIVDGTVSFAWIGSANYVKTRVSVPSVRYLATYLEWNRQRTEAQPYYRAAIVTMASSDIRTLQDLRSTRFGFTDLDSTSGYAYPRMILASEGIDPAEFFQSVFFLGKHENIIQSLLAGSLDAGAISDGTYYNAREAHGDIFRVLAWSEPIPLDAIVAAGSVPMQQVETVRAALLAVPADHPVNVSIQDIFGWPAAGFAVLGDTFYDSVDRALGLTGAE